MNLWSIQSAAATLQLGQLAGGMDDAAAGMAVRCFAGGLRTDQALVRIAQKAEQEVADVAN